MRTTQERPLRPCRQVLGNSQGPRSQLWTRGWARRLARRFALGLALLVLAGASGGCVWLQNEFFVYDVVPPQTQPEPAAHAPW